MRILLIAYLMFLSAMASAEPVIVRAGEHVDFSRLAFRFPDSVNWGMGRVNGGYEIRLKGSDSELDISDVYRRISRDRISAIRVSADNTRVTLDLACDCYADAFEFRLGLLVVDIKDGAAPEDSAFEEQFSADETARPVPVETAVIPPKALAPSEEKPPRPPQVERRVLLPLLTQKPEPHELQRTAGPALPKAEELAASALTTQESEQLSEMQSEMLAQISRAASQGLLQADVVHPVPATKAHSDTTEPVTTPVPATEPVEEHLNIHVETSIDRDIGGLGIAELLTDSGSACLQNKVLDVIHWGDSHAVTEQIIRARTGLVGEFDKVNSKAVQKLVQAYIYAGFGVEAEQVLQVFDADLKYAQIYKTMAQIVDKGWSAKGAELVAQAGCDSAAALWAVLAKKKLEKDMIINRGSVLTAFSELPLHLRRHLGPDLAAKFLDIDDRATATALRNAVARADGDAGAEFRMLDARLDQQRGRHAAAEHVFEDIVAEDSTLAPKALIALFQSRLDLRNPIDPEYFASAEVFIFTQKDTNSSAQLQLLIAQAYGRSGDFHAANKALMVLKDDRFIDKEMLGRAWSDVLTSALTGNDQNFVEFIFATQNYLSLQTIPRQIRRQAARRLLNNRFVKMATRVLAAPVQLAVDDRLILAQAAVLNRKPAIALDLVEGLDSEAAILIRAQAFELSKNHARAAHEYSLIPDSVRAQGVLWRAGDWQQLQQAKNSPVQAAAQIMLLQPDGNKNDPEDDIGIIAHDRRLLDTSRAMRESIAAILESFPPMARQGQ